jgi:hypothetical protein
MAKAIPMIKRSAMPIDSKAANDLRSLIRDQFTSKSFAERASFVATLTLELRRINLSIGVYLALLGIPRDDPQEVTPTEVGHLIRFLLLNVPQARSAIAKAASQHGFQVGGPGPSGEPQAA